MMLNMACYLSSFWGWINFALACHNIGVALLLAGGRERSGDYI